MAESQTGNSRWLGCPRFRAALFAALAWDDVGSWHNPGMNYQDDSGLVTLAEFSSEQEFLVMRALLESEGFECFCPDLYSGLYIEAVGRGYTLQVRREDFAAARALLDAPNEPFAEDEGSI